MRGGGASAVNSIDRTSRRSRLRRHAAAQAEIRLPSPAGQAGATRWPPRPAEAADRAVVLPAALAVGTGFPILAALVATAAVVVVILAVEALVLAVLPALAEPALAFASIASANGVA